MTARGRGPGCQTLSPTRRDRRHRADSECTAAARGRAAADGGLCRRLRRGLSRARVGPANASMAKTEDERSQRRREQKVSFHLEQMLGKDFELPDNVSSVDFLLTLPFDQISDGAITKSRRRPLVPSA